MTTDADRIREIDAFIEGTIYGIPGEIVDLLNSLNDVDALVRYSYDVDNYLFNSWAEDRLENIGHGLDEYGSYDAALANADVLRIIIEKTENQAKRLNAQMKLERIG